MNDTTTSSRRRSNSISEYSQIFSSAGNNPSSLMNQKRHPSLSMRQDRAVSFSKLGINIASLASGGNESAIDDTETVSPLPGPNTSARAPRSKTDDPVGLGRRLSQGARAIMYNGNRLRGDSISMADRPADSRSYSVSSTASSNIADSAPVADNISSKTASDAGKQIKRKLSPTGERMLRGELAFH